jgi:hypothetical protein
MSGSWSSSCEACVTLLELEQSLPNGLHDAQVRKIEVDYELHKVTIDVAVWVGDVDDPPKLREAYKKGRLVVSGLLFIVLEPPDAGYPFKNSTDLCINGCDMTTNIDKDLLESLPADAFVRSFFVNEWNAFIHIAAREAEILWANEGAVTDR